MSNCPAGMLRLSFSLYCAILMLALDGVLDIVAAAVDGASPRTMSAAVAVSCDSAEVGAGAAEILRCWDGIIAAAPGLTESAGRTVLSRGRFASGMLGFEVSTPASLRWALSSSSSEGGCTAVTSLGPVVAAAAVESFSFSLPFHLFTPAEIACSTVSLSVIVVVKVCVGV